MSNTRKRKFRRRRVSRGVSLRAKILSGGGRNVKLIPTNRTKKVRAFTKKDFNSGDGMLTTVWGPSMWHFLHTMSFNYPVEPTHDQKKHYMDFVLNLRNVLPRSEEHTSELQSH